MRNFPGIDERLVHANATIAIIAKYGRRFFWDENRQRLAQMFIGPQNSLYVQDDYTGRLIRISKRVHWAGFSHGGTLRKLLEALADYVWFDQKLSRFYIGLERSWANGDTWGYGSEAIRIVRSELHDSPVFEPVEEMYEPLKG